MCGRLETHARAGVGTPNPPPPPTLAVATSLNSGDPPALSDASSVMESLPEVVGPSVSVRVRTRVVPEATSSQDHHTTVLSVVVHAEPVSFSAAVAADLFVDASADRGFTSTSAGHGGGLHSPNSDAGARPASTVPTCATAATPAPGVAAARVGSDFSANSTPDDAPSLARGGASRRAAYAMASSDQDAGTRGGGCHDHARRRSQQCRCRVRTHATRPMHGVNGPPAQVKRDCWISPRRRGRRSHIARGAGR
jgi:hypothetical protein